MKRNTLTSLLALAILISLTASGHAATITVGDPLTLCTPLCDYDNVKDAVANAADGDVIEIQPGTYAEGHIYVDKDLTLKGASTMPTIDGAAHNYTVRVAAKCTVTLDNLRLDSAGSASNSGTATLDNRGTARLDTVWIIGKAGVQNSFGGVRNAAGALLILEGNSVVSGNEGINMGGGISNFGSLVVRNSTIAGNSGNIGGGIYSNNGVVAVISSSISGNHADDEGGGYIRLGASGWVSIFPSSSFSGNTADVDCDTYKDLNKTPSCLN